MSEKPENSRACFHSSFYHNIYDELHGWRLSAPTLPQVVSFLPQLCQEILDSGIESFKLAGLLKNFILQLSEGICFSWRNKRTIIVLIGLWLKLCENYIDHVWVTVEANTNAACLSLRENQENNKRQFFLNLTIQRLHYHFCCVCQSCSVLLQFGEPILCWPCCGSRGRFFFEAIQLFLQV